MTLRPGDSFDRYTIEEQIGQGGMGVVYRAHDARLSRRVALKLLRLDRSNDPGKAAQRLIQEARTAAALDHPGVVAIFDVGEVDETPFIAMEYVVGRSLRALIHEKRIGAEERIRWLTDIARALSAAHRAGLVHRDVKPENVMVRDDGVVKLLDFGIARDARADVIDAGLPSESANRTFVESTISGTPQYMAPEQVRGAAVDARADQFAWGVLAYEVMTGGLPWKSIHEGVETMVAVVTEHQERLPAAALGGAVVFAEVVDRALEKDPARRFATMADLLTAIQVDAVEVAPTVMAETCILAIETVQTKVTTAQPHPVPVIPPREVRLSRRWVKGALFSMGTITAVVAGVAVFQARAPAPLLLRASLGTAIKTTSSVAAPPAWTPSPEALEAYNKGSSFFKNGALSDAAEQFAHAVDLQPDFAAAFLEIVFTAMVTGPTPVSGEPYHAAARLRNKLDTRGLDFLHALEPYFDRDPPDGEETSRRLGELSRRYPNDQRFLLDHGFFLSTLGRFDEATEVYERLLALDPNIAVPWLDMSYIHARKWEFDKAYAALEKCKTLAPNAFEYIQYKAEFDAATGRCADMEADTKEWILKAPDNAWAEMMRATALFAQKKKPDMVYAAVSRASALAEPKYQAADVLFGKSRRHVYEGNFVAAQRGMEELFRRDDVQRATYYITWSGIYLVELRREMGDIDGAATIAAELVRRKGTLPHAGQDHEAEIAADPTMVLVETLLRAKRITPAEFEAKRLEWLSAWRGRGAVRHERMLWLKAYAETARTAEEATTALGRLDEIGAPILFFEERLVAVATARVFLLGGRVDLAIDMLQKAVASCLEFLEPFRYVEAYVLLGQALEKKEDRKGACAAYQAVLDRLGRAQPKSLTADEARARFQALQCGSK